MSPPISLQSRTHNKLIAQRLKLEAVVRSINVASQVCGGQLVVETCFGNVPVVLNNMKRDGVQVKMQAHLGNCSNPDAEFLDFIACSNGRVNDIEVELIEDAAICVRWVHEFPEGIVVSDVTAGLIAFGDACREIREELRERFFVQPVGDGFQRTGGVE